MEIPGGPHNHAPNQQNYNDHDLASSDSVRLAIAMGSESDNETSAATKSKKEEKSKEKREKDKTKSKSGNFWRCGITIAQVCVFLYALLVTYLCLTTADFAFFTWHPLLMSVGWMLLMSEAILVLSKDNVLVEKIPKRTRLQLHWILQSVAVTLILIGFAIVYINKNNVHKVHFTSWHGIFGLIGVIFSVPSCINGATALYSSELRQYIGPKFNKFFHIFTGLLSYVFGGLALVLSVYTKWFERNTNGSWIAFVFGLVLVVTAVGWTLWKPVKGCWKRFKKFL